MELSFAQVNYLRAIVENEGPMNLNTLRALLSRGLVKHKPHADPNAPIPSRDPADYALTDAGWSALNRFDAEIQRHRIAGEERRRAGMRWAEYPDPFIEYAEFLQSTRPAGAADPLQGRVLQDIRRERERQDAKWGADREQPHTLWHTILSEEVGEVAEAVLDVTFPKAGTHELDDLEHLYEELVQTAAVATAHAEAVQRQVHEIKNRQEAIRAMVGI